MIFTFSFFIGAFMFVHYGCSILKHNANKSTKMLMVNLLIITVCSVLVMRASYIKDVNDLLTAYMTAAFSQTALQIYLWFYGLSIKNAATILHSIRMPVTEYLNQLKKSL